MSTADIRRVAIVGAGSIDQHDPWTPELVETVAAARRAAVPLEQSEERVAWRDRALMALARHRRAVASGKDT